MTYVKSRIKFNTFNTFNNVETICWLKVTDYMRGWARCALGCGTKIGKEPLISLYQIMGAKEVLEIGTDDDLPDHGTPGNAMSATWRCALEVGLEYDPATMECIYGVTEEALEQYLPIACPPTAMTVNGISRAWTNDTCFGREQAMALQKLLREAFWTAVGQYSKQYAQEHRGEKYAQVEMIEAFCRETKTDDMYVEAMRREWQRRNKRSRN